MALANPKTYLAQVAYQTDTGDGSPAIAKNSPVTVYSGSDTLRDTPLPVYNTDHTPRLVFRTNTHGVIPAFVLEDVDDAVAVTAGTDGIDFEVPLVCREGIQGPQGDAGTPGTIPTDEAISEQIDNRQSQTYKSLVTDFLRPPTMAQMTYHVHPTLNYHYEVTRVRTFGNFVAGLVKKRTAYDYDKTWIPGTQFKPLPREPIENAMKVTGASILFNASGYVTTAGATQDNISGLDISNGIVHSPMGTGSRGSEAIGFRSDGTVGTYSWHENGDTENDLIADGVVDTFAFGPLLVRDGVQLFPESNPIWNDFNTPSGRQLFGVSETGDIILVSIHGVTGVSGAMPNENARLMKELGCHHAIMLDGGGSVQTAFGGSVIHASSDVGKVRAVPNFGVIHAPIQGAFDSGWINLPFRAGFVEDATTRKFQARNQDGFINLRGRIRRSPAADFVSTGYSTIGDMFPHWVPVNSAAGAGVAVNGYSVIISLVAGTDTGIYVRPMPPTSGGISYLDVGGFGYYLW